MEGEVNNFAMVWITVFASLCYCHAIAKFIPKGTNRFLAILPVIILFTLLPLNLTTVHLGCIFSFFVVCLTNCKILLFAFGKGPLSCTPPIPLSLFIPLACLPIKIRDDQSNKESKETPSQQTLELLLAMIAAFTRILIHEELEPQFKEPYLATSLQDFWGRRWNVMVSDILKPTIFEPTRSIFTGLVGRKYATFLGVLATFFVSGLMHELFFYTYGRQKTRWEVTCFFLLHGLSLSIEMILKKMVKEKFRLPTMVSRPLTVMYVVGTGIWLFFPPFSRGNAEVKVCQEYRAFVEFVRNGRLVSPNDMSCPYLYLPN
ncbi:Long-chain-alcohol O-fatty-acyltransferase [Heracleum sosnowskyi]|uniref:Long-chain-alcohol O-fatty-acyltransferase n=1 Tax=Heracleum sosnowskyi TaxID=360622 RepID=A0AAD8IAJ3_9APIA|nr:Long-chain-alcohol O-fatty-acyltransferase [Heracleum sosnowskyi]